MKVSNTLVTIVTIKQHIEVIYTDMSNPNMKMSNIFVISVTFKQHIGGIY